MMGAMQDAGSWRWKTRGYYCGIGIYNGKTEFNLGTLWRSAWLLGANFVFTVGRRYRPQSSDTTKAILHIPYWRFDTWEDLCSHIPYNCQLVGVELTSAATPLETFHHPERAVYLLGPEDGNLPAGVLARCQHVVQFTSRQCLNVAAAGSIVLYDRQTKLGRVAEKGG